MCCGLGDVAVTGVCVCYCAYDVCAGWWLLLRFMFVVVYCGCMFLLPFAACCSLLLFVVVLSSCMLLVVVINAL